MMSPIVVGMIVFACTLAGALIGDQLRRTWSRNHIDEESRDTVEMAIGLIATITALVLGLVTASAKSSFDAVDTSVKEIATDILTLDRLLARYGPETKEIRVALRQAVADRIDTTWPQESSRPARVADPLETASRVEGLVEAIRRLAPRDDSQRALQSRALELAERLLKTRWLVFTAGGPSVPVAFLVVIVFWLTISFTSYGLIAPRNATVFVVLLVCALSVGSVIFLILELGEPFEGLLKVSGDALSYAHAHLNQ